MKRVTLSLLVCFVLVIAFSAPSIAADVSIEGSAYFKTSLIAKYMKKHGYHYVSEVMYNNIYKTNLFGAKNAEVIVKNTDDIIVGFGRTDKKGDFSFTVPGDREYKIVIRFQGREIEKKTNEFQTGRLTADLGHFTSDEVDSWIEKYPVTYCKECDIRYLEAKGSM